MYFEFAKKTSQQTDPSEAVTSPVTATILAQISDLKAQNEALRMDDCKSSVSLASKPKQADKNTKQDYSGVVKFFVQAIAHSVSGYLPNEKSNLEHKVAEHELKIKNLRAEIVKESSKHPDPVDTSTSAREIAILATINELKSEIAALNQRIASKAEEVIYETPVCSDETLSTGVMDREHKTEKHGNFESADGVSVKFASELSVGNSDPEPESHVHTSNNLDPQIKAILEKHAAEQTRGLVAEGAISPEYQAVVVSNITTSGTLEDTIVALDSPTDGHGPEVAEGEQNLPTAVLVLPEEENESEREIEIKEVPLGIQSSTLSPVIEAGSEYNEGGHVVTTQN